MMKTSCLNISWDDALKEDADEEQIGRAASDTFDNSIYKLCTLDIIFIFNVKGEDTVDIPSVKNKDPNHIIHKKMSLGKACDIYRTTLGHLRHCGVRRVEKFNRVCRIFRVGKYKTKNKS